MKKLPVFVLNNIAKVRKLYTAKMISEKLDLTINTVNHATSKYRLLSQNARMSLWRKYSPINALKIQEVRSLKRCKNINEIEFNKELGYVIGCCFGDACISLRKGSVGIELQTRNLSFANSFSKALENASGIKPRFYERLYKTKILPNKVVYKNLKYYVVILYSTVFVKYLVEKLHLAGSKSKHKISLKWFLSFNASFRVGFLKGLFDSDGSVYFSRRLDKNLGICIALYSSYKKLLRVVRRVLLIAGFFPSKISTYKNCMNKEAYRIILSRSGDIIKFHNLIGSGIDYKAEKLNKAVKLISKL